MLKKGNVMQFVIILAVVAIIGVVTIPGIRTSVEVKAAEASVNIDTVAIE